MQIVQIVQGRQACTFKVQQTTTTVQLTAAGDNSAHRSLLERITVFLHQCFLPEGFPDSVPPDYIAFQTFDTLQALCSYVRGVLSQNALLVGVGVGTSTATALSATITFVLKDLTGMLGSILFSYSQGANLDAYDKQFRLFADACNNIGLALELASPSFPSLFLLLAALGSLARAVTGVAGAATRAAMTQHFALCRNAADVSAKESAQETATVMVGMLVGLAVTQVSQGRPAVAWAVFCVLTVLHMYCNIRAVRALQLQSINRTRADLLLAAYQATGGVPTPSEIAATEPLVPPPVAQLLPGYLSDQCASLRVHFGASVAQLAGAQQLLLCPWDQHARSTGGAVAQHCILALRGNQILVVLREGVRDHDLLQAYLLARLIAIGLAEVVAHRGTQGSSEAQQLLKVQQLHEQQVSRAVVWMVKSWPDFVSHCQQVGWQLQRVNLAAGQQRVIWQDDKKAQ